MKKSIGRILALTLSVVLFATSTAQAVTNQGERVTVKKINTENLPTTTTSGSPEWRSEFSCNPDKDNQDSCGDAFYYKLTLLEGSVSRKQHKNELVRWLSNLRQYTIGTRLVIMDGHKEEANSIYTGITGLKELRMNVGRKPDLTRIRIHNQHIAGPIPYEGGALVTEFALYAMKYKDKLSDDMTSLITDLSKEVGLDENVYVTETLKYSALLTRLTDIIIHNDEYGKVLLYDVDEAAHTSYLRSPGVYVFVAGKKEVVQALKTEHFSIEKDGDVTGQFKLKYSNGDENENEAFQKNFSYAVIRVEFLNSRKAYLRNIATYRSLEEKLRKVLEEPTYSPQERVKHVQEGLLELVKFVTTSREFTRADSLTIAASEVNRWHDALRANLCTLKILEEIPNILGDEKDYEDLKGELDDSKVKTGNLKCDGSEVTGSKIEDLRDKLPTTKPLISSATNPLIAMNSAIVTARPGDEVALGQTLLNQEWQRFAGLEAEAEKTPWTAKVAQAVLLQPELLIPTDPTYKSTSERAKLYELLFEGKLGPGN